MCQLVTNRVVTKETPFATEGRELAALLRKKAPDEEIQPIVERIHNLAIDLSLDPLVTSTDVFTTAVLWVGSKSLSHVLAAIERTKDRLLDAGGVSEAARAQIITAVMAYWSAHPGVALSIVEKLLNYSILSPETVIQWALVSHAGAHRGRTLADAYVFELVFNTVVKVTSRLRQVVASSAAITIKKQANNELDGDSAMESDGIGNDEAQTAEAEATAARHLFRLIDDAMVAWASGTKDEMVEDGDIGNGHGPNTPAERNVMVQRWGQRWLRVFRRRSAIEEAFLLDVDKKAKATSNGA